MWEHGGSYTVTEAKARASIGSAYAVGKMLVKQGKIPDAKGLTPDQELLHYLLSDYEDKGLGGAPAGGAQMMQMGFAWTVDRATARALPRCRHRCDQRKAKRPAHRAGVF